MVFDNQKCPICKKDTNWDNEKTFIMEYRDPRIQMAGYILFFHPKCFISTAGETWAKKLGYSTNNPKTTRKKTK